MGILLNLPIKCYPRFYRRGGGCWGCLLVFDTRGKKVKAQKNGDEGEGEEVKELQNWQERTREDIMNMYYQVFFDAERWEYGKLPKTSCVVCHFQKQEKEYAIWKKFKPVRSLNPAYSKIPEARGNFRSYGREAHIIPLDFPPPRKSLWKRFKGFWVITGIAVD